MIIVIVELGDTAVGGGVIFVGAQELRRRLWNESDSRGRPNIAAVDEGVQRSSRCREV